MAACLRLSACSVAVTYHCCHWVPWKRYIRLNKRMDGERDQTRPDQHTYTHTYEDERGQLLPPLCVYAALPPSSHRPHVFRCDAAARCGAVRIVRQRRQTPTTLEASYSPPEKKKKGKKIKKGNLLPCGGGGRGGARSSLFRDAPDVQRGEPKVKSPRTDGRPADAFFFSPPPPPRPPPLDSGALHVYAQHHGRADHYHIQSRPSHHPRQQRNRAPFVPHAKLCSLAELTMQQQQQNATVDSHLLFTVTRALE